MNMRLKKINLILAIMCMSWGSWSATGTRSTSEQTDVKDGKSQKNNVAVYEFEFKPDGNVQRVNSSIRARSHNRFNANRARVTLKQAGQVDMSLYFERGYDRFDEDVDVESADVDVDVDVDASTVASGTRITQITSNDLLVGQT